MPVYAKMKQQQQRVALRVVAGSIAAGVALVVVMFILGSMLAVPGFGMLVMIMAVTPFVLALFFQGYGYTAAIAFNLSCFIAMFVGVSILEWTTMYLLSPQDLAILLLGCFLIINYTVGSAWFGHMVRHAYDWRKNKQRAALSAKLPEDF